MPAAVVLLVLLSRGDVGTALVFMPIIISDALHGGCAAAVLFAVIGGTLLAVIAFMSVTEGYRMQRFQTWLHPESDFPGAVGRSFTGTWHWLPVAGGASASAPAGRSGARCRRHTTTFYLRRHR